MARKARAGFGRRLADMSLPPGERGRKPGRRHLGGTPPAQMSHASSPKARKRRREGEKKMRRFR
jgi:hypothetical protein